MRNLGLCFLLLAIAAVAAAKPTVLMLYTGGTIGMVPTDDGYAPKTGYLQSVMDSIANFQNADVPAYEVLEYDPLIDSSNMHPANWELIANDIYRFYDSYDGFVVIHGTDTLAYTASALSFLLDGLTNKTVVVTGAQIPVAESYNDGIFNLMGALMFAGRFSIPEVTVFFNHALYRGNRVQKLSAWDLAAFDSGNLPPLANLGVTFDVNDALIRAPGRQLLRPTPVSDAVVELHLFPGIEGDWVRAQLSADLRVRGCVILAFGTGNGPADDEDFMSALRDASNRGVVLVDVTQTHQGIVNLSEYAASLKAAGAVSAFDMTPEAAFTKLAWLLGNPMFSVDDVRRLMATDLRGELTPPTDSAFLKHEL
jgi:L-asparaginase